MRRPAIVARHDQQPHAVRVLCRAVLCTVLSVPLCYAVPHPPTAPPRWYADRPEVRKWQEDTKDFARQYKYVKTLLGRRRILPNINGPDRWAGQGGGG